MLQDSRTIAIEWYTTRVQFLPNHDASDVCQNETGVSTAIVPQFYNRKARELTRVYHEVDFRETLEHIHSYQSNPRGQARHRKRDEASS